MRFGFKQVAIAALLFAVPALAAEKSSQVSKDDPAIKQLQQKFEKGWKAADPNALAQLFTSDGSLMNPMGEMAKGQDEIRQLFQRHFKTDLKGSTMRTDIDSVSQLGPNLVLADMTQHVEGANVNPMVREHPVHITAVLLKEGNEYKAKAIRAFAPMPQQKMQQGVGGSGEQQRDTQQQGDDKAWQPMQEDVPRSQP